MPCNENNLTLSIDCTESQENAGGGLCAEQGGNALLRIAVRCFDPAVTDQVRYKDSHDDLSLSFSELVDGREGTRCDDFIAAAHLVTANNGSVQVQCFRSDNGHVPDCGPATAEEIEDLGERFLLYAAINPQQGANSCGPAQFDVGEARLRSGSLDGAYQGILAGDYICTQDEDLAVPWNACDDPGGTDDPPRGQFGRVRGFNLAPQSEAFLGVHPGSAGFDICCDHEPGEVNCSQPNKCSPLDVLCSHAAVFAVCRDADCGDPGATFLPLDRVVWFGPRADIDPGDTTLKPSAFASSACLKFSFSNLTGSQGKDEKLTDPHVFGPAAPPGPVEDGCLPSTDARADVDFDQVYDICDRVVGPLGPADGVQRFHMRYRIRNEGFPEDLGSACGSACFDNDPAGGLDEVLVGSLPANVVPDNGDVISGQQILCGPNLIADTPATGDDVEELPPASACLTELDPVVSPGPNEVLDSSIINPPGIQVVEVPDGVAGFDDQAIEWRSSSQPGGAFETAAEPFQPRVFGYASDGTADGVFTFEAGLDDPSGGPEDIAAHRDLNPSPTNSYVNLNCDQADDLLSVDPPRDLAVRDVGPQREVYAVGDVTTSSGPEGRLFVVDAQSHRLRSFPGGTREVAIPGSPRAVDVTRDTASVWRAYVARKLTDDTSTIAVVDVDPQSPGVATVDDGAGTLEIHGLPLDIEAHRFGTQVKAYVSSVMCVFVPGSLPGVPCPIWGCTLPHYDEEHFVTVADVTSPPFSKIAEYKVYSANSGCTTSETAVEGTEHMGAAFSLDAGRSKVFIANPRMNRVDVIDTSNDSLNTLPNSPVNVGQAPLDVDVVYKEGDLSQESAYVVLSGARSIQRIDVATLTLPEPPIALGGTSTRIPVAIVGRSDGRRLYTTNLWDGTISVVDIDEPDFENTVVGEVRTQTPARRLVLLDHP